MDKTIELNDHRSDSNLTAIENRRARRLEHEAAKAALETYQDEVENQFLIGQAKTIEVLLAKVQYLLGLYAETEEAQDPRRKLLIENVFDDLHLLSGRLDERS